MERESALMKGQQVMAQGFIKLKDAILRQKEQALQSLK